MHGVLALCPACHCHMPVASARDNHVQRIDVHGDDGVTSYHVVRCPLCNQSNAADDWLWLSPRQDDGGKLVPA